MVKAINENMEMNIIRFMISCFGSQKYKNTTEIGFLIIKYNKIARIRFKVRFVQGTERLIGKP